MSRSTQTPPLPFPTKSEVLGFKKDMRRSKEISFSTKYQQHKKGNMFKKQNMPLLLVASPNWLNTIWNRGPYMQSFLIIQEFLPWRHQL